MNRKFPDALKKMYEIEIDYYHHDIDFEPYEVFNSKDDTAHWIKAWTGNESLDGSEYLIFGQDGSGGYVAFWLTKETDDLLNQPIVFFGSEGELGVISENFGDYVWLFAQGIGPYDAVAFPSLEGKKIDKLSKFARESFPSHEDIPKQIIHKARARYPDFEKMIQGLCR